ncbi:restriction endonuclease subunit S [Prevotella bivia DNF00650]|uniref:restriction endonuclease subunit S n=1 Tax=Prevotella bivia TaxID=28125 RepID=UPI00050DCA57|nr:restriction endonuclease subunit S [Prevotella bivia]KGF38956.1 restriction endonuclease subunit S [Prevotella bivia DNF00650]
MEEMILYTLGDIVNVNTAQYSPKDTWIKALYLDTGNITENKIDKIQEFECSSLPSRAKRKVKHGDIIYSTVRPNQKHYGYITNPAKNLLVSTGFTVLSPHKDLTDSKFIYYWLSQNNIVEYLHNLAEQSVSAYPSIKASDICELEIKLPSLEYQTKAANILSSLDDKIELNRRINDNLKLTA